MKREYTNPMLMIIDISADVDTVTVSDAGDGMTDTMPDLN